MVIVISLFISYFRTFFIRITHFFKLAKTSSLYLSIINLFFAVTSISITTLTRISLCTSGDLLCVVFMTSAKATPLKPSRKALISSYSIAIMEVPSFMRKIQTFPKDRFPNFFVDVKSTNATQKR